jgi:hypothetical protein
MFMGGVKSYTIHEDLVFYFPEPKRLANYSMIKEYCSPELDVAFFQ